MEHKQIPVGVQPDLASSTRPGAMDAYRVPSLQNGQRVQYRAPMLMGSPVRPNPMQLY